METCDVLIVGGGPAGSSCARALSRRGIDVVVVDKAQFPRDKVCAGWITPAVIDELTIDLSEYREGRTLQPITGFRTSLWGAAEVVTTFPQVVSYGIRRCEFDHYLLERSGARLKLGTSLESLRRDGDRWVVNDSVAAPLLIGAGGHFCPVARQTAASAGDRDVVVLAQEVEFAMTDEQQRQCPIDESIPELFFSEDLKGYAWCFRKGSYLNVGLGRAGDSHLSAQVEAFYQTLQSRGRIPPGASPRFHGHAYRLYAGPSRTLNTDRVLLIGDAAGLAYPQSGEGIRPAIESGLLAAETILETSQIEHNSLAQRLEKRLKERFGRPAKRTTTRTLLPASWRRFAARRLMESRWFARRVLIERWFLHRHQPPLASVPVCRG